MGFVQRPAIGNRRDRRNQLQWGYANFLPHRNRTDRSRAPVLQFPEHASALAGQVYSSLLAESEVADVVVKFWRTESQSNLNRADVARQRQNIGDGQHAKRFVVANAVPRHVNLAILAIEDFFG